MPTVKIPLALSLAAALGLACAGPGAAAKPPAAPSAAVAPAPARTPEPPATPDAEFRASKPPPAPVEPRFEAPIPVEARLATGARLLVVENHAVPLVSIEAVVPAGVDAEPAGKGGLASFTAAMLTEGTKEHPGLAFAAALEDLAARLFASADLETSRVRLNCLKETLPRALDLLAEALTRPAFSPEDVERKRGLLLTGLLQKKASPQALAADEAARLLYGEKHPWGRPAGGTPQTMKAISRDDLVRFHQALYRPDRAIVSVSGDTTPAEVRRLLDEKLASWKRKASPRLELPPLPEVMKRSLTLVDKPGTSQSQVWAVGRLYPASHPDRVPMAVANNVLGGLFGSRLNQNLREEKGYSYGVASRIRLGRTHGSFYVTGSVQARFTAESLAEYQKELAGFESGELRDGELARAKEAIIRGLPAALETNDAVSGSIATAAFQGLPLDWFQRLPGLVSAVDATAVASVARRWLKPERMPVIVVGPRAESEEKLRALNLGPLTVRAAE
jgi:zinc protease